LSTGFPQYNSWFGKMVGQFLNGDFGPHQDPHFTALLYAGDRFESKGPIVSALEQGQIVITDRYVGSNLAHQTARTSPEEREAFRAWIEHLEYGIYGLPKEDLVLYLRVPPIQAQSLVGGSLPHLYRLGARHPGIGPAPFASRCRHLRSTCPQAQLENR
jgi:dTMP kinase